MERRCSILGPTQSRISLSILEYTMIKSINAKARTLKPRPEPGLDVRVKCLRFVKVCRSCPSAVLKRAVLTLSRQANLGREQKSFMKT